MSLHLWEYNTGNTRDIRTECVVIGAGKVAGRYVGVGSESVHGRRLSQGRCIWRELCTKRVHVVFRLGGSCRAIDFWRKVEYGNTGVSERKTRESKARRADRFKCVFESKSRRVILRMFSSFSTVPEPESYTLIREQTSRVGWRQVGNLPLGRRLPRNPEGDVRVVPCEAGGVGRSKVGLRIGGGVRWICCQVDGALGVTAVEA
ncbi:hypothetical protein DFH07DRAFT_801751 [Mycena maculata]|uniref:Uncharacterized protein n=1 Tax=Mycena maculata TaxID=230809 RepID=A0AAD7JVL6_9AGAR|nr:hypothetical protein DFH07DRAFT_801751 [Mycena maculata]